MLGNLSVLGNPVTVIVESVLGDLKMDDPSSMVIKDDHGNSSLNVAVATTNMSTAAMAVIWFRRKLRQDHMHVADNCSASCDFEIFPVGVIGNCSRTFKVRIDRS
jgi:hypothetical protein